MRTRITLIAILALAALGAWLLLRETADPAADRVPSERGVEQRAGEGAQGRTPQLVGRGGDASGDPTDAAAAGRPSAVGRVVDPQGRGVAGVQIVASPRTGRRRIGDDLLRTADVLQRGLPEPSEPLARATSDAEGRFRLHGLDTRQRYRIAALPRVPYSRAAVEPYAFPPYEGELSLVVRKGVSICVRVVDGSDRGCEAVLTVWSRVPWGQVVRDRRTDADGLATIDGLTRGEHWIYARVPSVGRIRSTVVLPVDGEIILRLGHKDDSAVAGRIVGEGGHPIADAFVVASHYAGEAQAATWIQRCARTNADGRYRIGGLEAGKLDSVSATAAGHMPAKHGAGNRALGAGETTEIDLTLQPGLTLEGLVQQEDGTPVAGARVLATAGKLKHEVHSDKHGAFRVCPLPEGRVHLCAWATGLYPPQQADGLATDDAPRGIEVDLAASTPPVRIVVRPGLTMRGRCTCPDGKPLADVTVRATPDMQSLGGLYGLWMNVPFLAFTNADGAFSLTGIPPGTTWRLEAQGAGHRGTQGPIGPWTRTEGIGDVAFVLQAAARISGTVVDEDGAPVVGVTVQGSNETSSARTDAGGGFELRGLAARTYSVRVRDGSTQLVKVAGISLTPGEHREGLEIVVPPRLGLAGQLVDGDGDPVPVARLEFTPLVSSQGRQAQTRTDAEGRFDLLLWGAGPYGVTANGSDLATEVTAGGGEVRLVLVEQLPPLTVRIVDEAGLAVPHVRVTLERRMADGGSLTWGQEVDAGVLELASGARANLIRIDVDQARDAKGAPLPLLPARATAQPDEREIQIVLRPGLEIVGRLLDDRGEPVEGVTVRVGTTGVLNRRLSCKTDATGRFALGPMARGAHRVSWYAGDPWLPADPIEVEAGTDDLEIRLVRGAPFVVEVVDPDGKPLPAVRVNVRGRWNDKHISRGGRTDADGRCRIEGLPRDALYSLEARTTDETGAAYVTLRREAIPYGDGSIRVQMQAGVYLEGVVVSPDGEPVRAGSVQACDALGAHCGSTQLDGDSNTFRHGPLQPGTYRVNHRGWGKFASSAPIEVEAPATGLRLTLRHKTSFAGRIVNAGESKWSLIWTSGSHAWALNVAPGGGFTAPAVPADTGTLFGQEANGNRYVLLEDVDPERTSFEVAAKTGEVIRGRVEGQGATYVDIVRGVIHLGAKVGEDGTFEIDGVPEGAYDLTVYPGDKESFTRAGVEAGTTGLVLTLPADATR